MVANESLFNDYVCTIGYYLSLQMNGQQEELLSSFHRYAVNGNDEYDSKVSQIFTRCFKLINEILESYIIYKDELVDIKESISKKSLTISIVIEI